MYSVDFETVHHQVFKQMPKNDMIMLKLGGWMCQQNVAECCLFHVSYANSQHQSLLTMAKAVP